VQLGCAGSFFGSAAGGAAKKRMSKKQIDSNQQLWYNYLARGSNLRLYGAVRFRQFGICSANTRALLKM
jgi:hypothetical protein